MFRTLFLALTRNETLKRIFAACPVTRKVMRRFVAGTSWDDAQPVIAGLIEKGIKVTADYLVSDIRKPADVDQTVTAYLEILDRIDQAGWASEVELSVRPSAVGIALRDGEDLAIANVSKIAAKAAQIGTSIIIGTETPAIAARTMRVIQAVRQQHPAVGCIVAANFKRSEADCRTLTAPGSRVAICKGSCRTPAPAVYADHHDVDLSYIRCLKILMDGDGMPLVATHDPVLIEITQELAAHSNRSLKDFEFQMLYGARTIEQERLTDMGYTVRVRVPFGADWYSHATARLTRNPASFKFFMRAAFGLR